MMNRYTKLRLRRQVRRQKKSIEKAGVQASQEFERKVLKRWQNLKSVRRFVIGWLVLVGLLILGVFLQNRDLNGYYLTEVPVSGGTFREGMVGQISNMNPIFATSAADRVASSLQFNSLFTYNQDGKLVGDLAASIEVSDDGTVYTVELVPNVYWHDGAPFTADDVVYTYEAIQHPDTRSYLNASWRDILVEKKDDLTVTFSLPNEFTPFPHSLTEGGIIPRHILGDVDPSKLRGHSFNNKQPIGTGPFVFENLLIETSDPQVDGQLRLKENPNYFKGDVKIDNFVLSTFIDRENMIERFLDGELAAIAGLNTVDRERLIGDIDSDWYDLQLNNIVFVFFKTDDGLLKSKSVRQALSLAIDNIAIHDVVSNRYKILDSPILPNQLGYSDKYVQSDVNVKKANQLLSDAGWKQKSGDENDGYRYKDGKRLKVQLITQNSDDFPAVAREISQQWLKVGVESEVIAVSESDIQQNNISSHNYQALLFGVSLGADPDPFVYWHSSQAGVNGFNLSELEDGVIDDALESGRTRVDSQLREAKYEAFLKRWVDLAPAHALYQPSYGYVQRKNVEGFNSKTINSPAQRFYNVHEWTVRTDQGIRPY